MNLLVLTDVFAGALIFCCILGASALAMWLNRKLPEQHLSSDTKDTVKIAMALVATMTAMILGLLVSSAKGTYDAEKKLLVEMSADLAFLDHALTIYGPDSVSARAAVRNAADTMRRRYWPETDSQVVELDPETSSGEAVYQAIHDLAPQTDEQRDIKDRALDVAVDIGHSRWLIYQHSGPSLSAPLLASVVCWLSFLFFSFGLFAPRNGTVLAALFVSASSVSTAVFLILELDQPFDGLVKVSSQPLMNVLAMMAGGS